jgi:L-lactate dehydrogenase (cytochrome)
LNYLIRRAQRRIPRFAFDFLEGGTGDHRAVLRNRMGFDAVDMTWTVCGPEQPSTSVSLFGQRYAAPLGIAPIGMDGAIWPGASKALAKAAHEARIPYTAGTLASATIEDLALLCPDTLWFQLYGFPKDDHAISFDLIRRADKAGAKVLVVTLDVPGHAKRTLDLYNGITVPFRPSLRLALRAALAPAWSVELLRHGQPGCPNMECYVPPGTTLTDLSVFVRENVRGSFSWGDIRAIRKAWPRALVLKEIMCPADAERAVDAGADGIVVSNHGGRQLDAGPATIDVLPAVIRTVRGRAAVFVDGGVRSGLDVTRALALGADAVFAGRAFMIGLAALGASGASYVADMLLEELRVALRQLGVEAPGNFAGVSVHQPNAWSFETNHKSQ